MRVLVTGGSGFVGAAAARALAAAGHDVVILDSAPPAGGAGPCACECEQVTADIRDGEAIERALSGHRIDVVLHGAALPSIASCERDPVAAFEVNVAGTARITAAAARSGVRRVITISSEETYGEFQHSSAREDDRAEPVSVYGASKLAAESAGRAVGRSTRIEHVAARLSWAYGPGYPRPRLPRSMILDALAGRLTSLTSGASHRVDLTYIDDATDAFRRLIEAPTLAHDVYNIGSGVCHSVAEIAEAVRALVPGWRFDIGPGPLITDGGAPLPRKGALVIDRIRALGYAPRVTLSEGVRREYEAIAGRKPGRAS